MNNFYSKKTVLVTGGAGFIGSHITEALIKLNAHVIVIDNLSTGSLDNLQNIYDKITFIQDDIRTIKKHTQKLKNVDYIFHLAACVSVPLSMKKPSLCYQSNIEGTFNLLEFARTQKIKRFIFSSSSAVYGEHSNLCTESTPSRPTSTYGYSKLLGELYCQEYATLHNVPSLSLRYFNVIGERQNPQGAYAGVYAKFLYNIKHNLPITIFGDGNQTRDFVPVQEIVHANLTLAQLPSDQCKGQPINIATEKSISILNLYETLKKEHPHYNLQPTFQKQRFGDISKSQASSKLYKQLQSQI